MTRTIDINCDLGESFGNWRMGDDEVVLPLISSANIACGFHASDPVTLLRTVERARDHGVRVGAHPGLPDLLGFGRRHMAITREDAYAYIVYQVGALQAAARAAGTSVTHVKPHGALMSMVARDPAIADGVAAAVAATCDDPAIYFTAPFAGAELPEAAARHGVHIVAEVYPDLSYAEDGSVVIQRAKHETDVAFAVEQVTGMLERGTVTTETGGTIALEAQSICVHGDGPNALDVITAIRAALAERGWSVAGGSAAEEVPA